ncbi:MAG: TFIIB-type zinc finger domain-containing protein [Ruminococcus sp.]
MKAMVCEMCSSNDLVKQDGMFVCQHCGTKYSVEEAKKLMGTVKIDKTEETEKLLVLARRARDEQNCENAEKYYGMILQEDPNNWEATFFQVYFRSMQCRIMDIENAARSVSNNINTTIKLISEMSSTDEKSNALDIVISYSEIIATMLSTSAINHYREHKKASMAYSDCYDRIKAIESIYTSLENSLKRYFPASSDRIVEVQKNKISYISSRGEFVNQSYLKTEMVRLASEIKTKDPSYTQPTARKPGCYVATAVYGSYDCPEVWTLRRYRDNTLAITWYGRAFIKIYYAISPTLVKWFGNTNWFKNMWKPTLDRMVEKLNNNGVEDTPYNDKQW